MTGNRRDHGDYVRKVQQDTHQYVRDLLAETEHLRTRVAVLESERERLSGIASGAGEVATTAEVLRVTVAGVQAENGALREELSRLREEAADQERCARDLEERLRLAEQDRERFSKDYIAIEQQSSSLANLYVASYRLHGTVDRQEVLASIQEIVANLIGSEEMALFELEPDGTALSLLAWQGLEPGRYRRLSVDGGLIARAVRTGDVLIVERDGAEGGRPEEEHLTACIPLKLAGRVTGALALFRLLPQKESFGPLDGELFDLLATQAAVALHCTSIPMRAPSGPVATP
jgi:hypothetical protein